MLDATSFQEKFTQLSSGHKIPRLGFGTSRQKEDLGSLIKEAIRIGYRHFDTAKVYGNEEVIGQALKDAINGGLVKREDLFITTKIWNDDKHDVEKAIKGSLERLQLDYVDLYLIHWPLGEVDENTGKVTKQVPLHITWKGMEDQVKAGRAKSIGVSNFNVQLLLDLLSYAEIKPACNQVEVHPYLTREDLVGFCKKNGVEIIGFCPLGGNFPGKPEFTVKTLIEEPVIKELAAKYNKTPGQIILNWHLSRGYSVIPKTSNKSRIKENFEAGNFVMSGEDIPKISALNKDARVCNGRGNDFFGDALPMFA